MKEPIFKIGETVFYMENNTPKKNVIVGITTMTGNVCTLAHTLELKSDEAYHLYHFGSYQDCAESKCYASKEGLISETFKNL